MEHATLNEKYYIIDVFPNYESAKSSADQNKECYYVRPVFYSETESDYVVIFGNSSAYAINGGN